MVSLGHSSLAAKNVSPVATNSLYRYSTRMIFDVLQGSRSTSPIATTTWNDVFEKEPAMKRWSCLACTLVVLAPYSGVAHADSIGYTADGNAFYGLGTGVLDDGRAALLAQG
jgi:hypothetical protein